ncbi:MAG: DUF882 domain-containing protein [Alphaproteobacteria bacterium]|nr:DUF882 domain-containing protein [Alphaproteobacteria bacterium]
MTLAKGQMHRRLFLALAAGWLTLPLTARAAPAPAPLRRLRLSNAHTGETFDGPFRDDTGPIKEAMAELSVFLRDHHSGETIAIDVGVLDFLAGVMDAVGATKATVLSAYRTRETNAMLAKTTFGVADNSQHIYGRALDIRLESRNEEAMQAARAMLRGGVGWYPRSAFFHLDSGPVRNWTLDGGGLDRLLLEFRRLVAGGHLAIAPKGQLLVPRAKHLLSVQQRLSLHRALAKAEYAAMRH